VRRRIKDGRIAAFRDERGRVRVRASLPPETAAPNPQISQLWDELKAARQGQAETTAEAHQLRQELGLAHFHRREAQQELQSLQNETEELRDELENTRHALEHTQGELASMWRVMSARKERSGESLGDMTDGNEAFDLPQRSGRFETERSRIQGQISRVRDLSRRRRWPWPQAS
jgi:predicted  nucleic acid-binding Zn-ribbon protein